MSEISYNKHYISVTRRGIEIIYKTVDYNMVVNGHTFSFIDHYINVSDLRYSIKFHYFNGSKTYYFNVNMIKNIPVFDDDGKQIFITGKNYVCRIYASDAKTGIEIPEEDSHYIFRQVMEIFFFPEDDVKQPDDFYYD